MSPWNWEDLKTRRRMIRVYRNWSVSALMKSIRLRRVEDALYWLGVMFTARAGLPYLRRRVFSSSGEDNCDIWVMEHSERLLLDQAERLDTFAYATYLACLGTKWYELPDAIEYTEVRARAAEATHPRMPYYTAQALSNRYAKALAIGDVDDAFWCIAEGKTLEVRMASFYHLAAEAGLKAPDEGTRRLAAIVQRQLAWLGLSREKNHLWQLVWALSRRPLASTNRQPNQTEFAHLWRAAQARLARPLERPPSWALDGIHTTGHDPRFAGTVAGTRNMIQMFERDGRIDPARPGVTLHPITTRGGRA